MTGGASYPAFPQKRRRTRARHGSNAFGFASCKASLEVSHVADYLGVSETSRASDRSRHRRRAPNPPSVATFCPSSASTKPRPDEHDPGACNDRRPDGDVDEEFHACRLAAAGTRLVVPRTSRKKRWVPYLYGRLVGFGLCGVGEVGWVGLFGGAAHRVRSALDPLSTCVQE
jgi:hypothetical protein